MRFSIFEDGAAWKRSSAAEQARKSLTVGDDCDLRYMGAKFPAIGWCNGSVANNNQGGQAI